MNLLTLIVPIYNVEAYIETCLQSIVKSLEGRKGIQIILIDDGSEDQSGQIARSFARQYSCFSYYFKENGGLSDARNFGLQRVKTPYVTFIDSDDYLAEDYFFEVCIAMEKGPDLIVFDWLDVDGHGQTELVRGMDASRILWTVLPSSCNKIFRRNLFDGIEFPVGRLYEDVGTTYKVLKDVNKYVYISKPLYYYRKNREGSLLTSISPKINDIYFVLNDTLLFYKVNNAWSKENREGLEYQWIKLLLWSNMYRQLKFYKFRFFPFYRKMKYTRKLIYHHFPSWHQNGYLHLNRSFFEERMGLHYIHYMDRLGKSFWSTLSFVVIVIMKNWSR